ncbi:MAG: hypothetical protein ACK4ZW_00530 [Blastomonas sp.]
MLYQTGPVARGREAGGLRLVVTDGVPNPWSEAAKGMLHVKRIPHLRVPQHPGEENAKLVAWVGLNNSPIAIWNDEPPRNGWSDIIALVERIAPLPSLVPPDPQDRAAMFGLLHELCAEDGFGWNRRLAHFHALASLPAAQGDGSFQRLYGKYGLGGDPEHCRSRMIAVLGLLGERLRLQQDRGQTLYFGALTALDIYSACFMAMVVPLPIELCPTSPELHASYGLQDKAILAAVDPLLLDHRDRVYNRWLELPMRL